MVKQKLANTFAQQKADLRQKQQLQSLQKHDRVMRWVTGIACVAVLLLLFLLGTATDWTRGLKSSNGATPISSKLDSLKTGSGSTGATSIGGSGTNGTNGTNGTGGTNGTTTTGTTSTTTSTTSTTTNNTTNPPSQPPSGLVSLYADSAAGDDLQQIEDNAQQLGVTVACHNDVLVKVCDFTQGGSGQTMTTKSILGTGLVSSVTKNF